MSDEIRERLRIGAEFLSYFPTLRDSRTVGKMMGCTQQNISVIERMAAYKVVMRMKELLRSEHKMEQE